MRTAIIPGVTSEPTDPSCDNAPQVLYWFTLKKIIIIKKRKQSGFFYMVITWELCSLTAILLEKWGWNLEEELRSRHACVQYGFVHRGGQAWAERCRSISASQRHMLCTSCKGCLALGQHRTDVSLLLQRVIEGRWRGVHGQQCENRVWGLPSLSHSLHKVSARCGPVLFAGQMGKNHLCNKVL